MAMAQQTLSLSTHLPRRIVLVDKLLPRAVLKCWKFTVTIAPHWPAKQPTNGATNWSGKQRSMKRNDPSKSVSKKHQ